MEIEYERDDQASLVRASLHGAFAREGLIGLGERMRSEGVWPYGLLLDMRGLSSLPSADDLIQITEYVAAESATGARGPLALVAQNGELYARACAYLMLGVRRGRRIDVFRHLPDGEHWLRKEA